MPLKLSDCLTAIVLIHREVRSMYPYSDAEAARQAEAVKEARSGEEVCPLAAAQKANSAFSPCFQLLKKFGSNSQPHPFSASKAARQRKSFRYMERNFLSTQRHRAASPPLRAYRVTLLSLLFFYCFDFHRRRLRLPRRLLLAIWIHT